MNTGYIINYGEVVECNIGELIPAGTVDIYDYDRHAISYRSKRSSHSGAERTTDIFLNKDDADKALEIQTNALNDKKAADQKAKDQGKLQCLRCGTWNDKANSFEGEIIFRMNGMICKNRGQYCKGTQCFANEQMAHEG